MSRRAVTADAFPSGCSGDRRRSPELADGDLEGGLGPCAASISLCGDGGGSLASVGLRPPPALPLATAAGRRGRMPRQQSAETRLLDRMVGPPLVHFAERHDDEKGWRSDRSDVGRLDPTKSDAQGFHRAKPRSPTGCRRLSLCGCTRIFCVLRTTVSEDSAMAISERTLEVLDGTDPASRAGPQERVLAGAAARGAGADALLVETTQPVSPRVPATSSASCCIGRDSTRSPRRGSGSS